MRGGVTGAGGEGHLGTRPRLALPGWLQGLGAILKVSPARCWGLKEETIAGFVPRAPGLCGDGAGSWQGNCGFWKF